jgi:hypothetical protein
MAWVQSQGEGVMSALPKPSDIAAYRALYMCIVQKEDFLRPDSLTCASAHDANQWTTTQ